MKILVAGATGAIGRRLVPLLVKSGHTVSGTTRHADRARTLVELGAQPIVVDVFDAETLRDTLANDRPDAIIHQLTDLSGEDFKANSRLRIEGTRNLVDAAKAAGVEVMVAQSIAWLYVAGTTPAVETDPLDPDARGYAGVVALENIVAELPRGVVLRYGRLYGPGTWYAPDGLIAERIRKGEFNEPPAWASFVHVDDAAAGAAAALDWPAGPVNVVDDEPTTDWIGTFGGTPSDGVPAGRPISNAKARSLGWQPAYPRLSVSEPLAT
ncbi:MAG: Nucleoside-diphosphate-sugar epimerase [Actinomycetia bacterium]|nr:Nucleoside-diphosphate-sugar epimerase [Actinomycetes bacterium]